MSAMAMAFAQAGASDLDDLISNTEQEAGEPETGQSPSAAGDQASAEETPAPEASETSEATPAAEPSERRGDLTAESGESEAAIAGRERRARCFRDDGPAAC